MVTVEGLPPPPPASPAAPSASPTNMEIFEKDLSEAEATVAKFEALMAQSASLQAGIKKASLQLCKDLGPTSKDAGLSKERVMILNQRVKRLRTVALPETRSFFARLIVGRINLKLWSEGERDRLRDEYHKFKYRTNIAFIVSPCVVLFTHYYLRNSWSDVHWMTILHQLWLLYYYCSLAMRENMLHVNGSNIHPWWIIHHYIAAFVTAILITWPPTEIYLRFVPMWNFFLAYQGVVQLLLLFYQSRRAYANRALGRTSRIDVAYSETLQEFPTELVVLVPFVYTAHFVQVWLGAKLLRVFFMEMDPFATHWTNYREEVQCLICGLGALLLGIGNIVTTTKVLSRKSMKKRASPAAVEPVGAPAQDHQGAHQLPVKKHD